MKLLAMSAALAALAFPLAAQAAPADWSGAYIGANVGYGLGTATIDDQDCNISCSSQTFSPNGVSLGGVVGYNHQMGSAVIGIEGDYNWINAQKDKVTDWDSIHHAEFKSYGSVRGRLGLAVDNTLVYATAGLGILQQDVSAIDPNGTNTPFNGFVQNKTKAGLAAGGGVEIKVSDPWRLKLEYLYIGAPADSNIHDQFATGSCSTHTYCNFGVETHLHVIRVGANYAF